MTQVYHLDNFGTNLTSNTNAGDTTSPLNAIPSISAPFYLAFDATNINGNYEVLQISSKTATNVLHSALSYNHTTAEEVRMVVPAVELNNLSTVAGQVDGVWVDWTPTFANLTVGNGTLNALYTQVGKTVHFRMSFVLGSTSAVTGSIRFTVPVDFATHSGTGFFPIGTAALLDLGTNEYVGFPAYFSSTEAILRYISVSGSLLIKGVISSTAPFTWTTGDSFLIYGTYEAA